MAEVETSRDGAVLTITLNRPDVLNAFNLALHEGLAAALKELDLSPSEVVGVGDAENDLALLRCCGYGVAVASAVPALKEHADLVTKCGVGRGVVELVKWLIAGDLPNPVQGDQLPG